MLTKIHRLDALDFQGKTLELAGTALSKAKCVRFDIDLSIAYQLVFAKPDPCPCDCPIFANENY